MARKKLSDEEKEIKELKETLEKKLEQIEFLEEQVREIRSMFEKQGSEKAKWKHKAIKLEEKVDRLED